MAVTSDTFRIAFPEFQDTMRYQNASVNFWLTLATNLMDPYRWGNLLDFGQQLFVAHNLSLQAAGSQGGVNQVPGQILGPVTSAGVDKVNYARDPSSAMDPANGHWNLSSYGLRYIQLVRMIGAGPIQVGADPEALNSLSAWYGPFVAPY